MSEPRASAAEILVPPRLGLHDPASSLPFGRHPAAARRIPWGGHAATPECLDRWLWHASVWTCNVIGDSKVLLRVVVTISAGAAAYLPSLR
jgi:hypothetical protein